MPPPPTGSVRLPPDPIPGLPIPDMAINNAAAAFIGASVTLVLVIIFMVLMVVLVRQCLSFLAKRSAIREQVETQQRARAEFDRQRRTSITEPVPATFDWHHSIRIAGTPPPSYREAKKLPTFEDGVVGTTKQRVNGGGEGGEANESDSPEVGGLRGSRLETAENDSPQMAGVSNRDLEESLNGGIAQTRDVAVSIAIEHDQQLNGHVEGGVVLHLDSPHGPGASGSFEVVDSGSQEAQAGV